MSYQSLENAIRGVQLESAMTRDEKTAMQRAQMLHKQGKKKELKDFMMAMDASLRNKVKKSLNEDTLFEQEDPTNPDTGGAEETEMGKRQLHFIKYAAGEIMDYVDQKGDMDEWFQNKLTTVHDMIRGLHSYIEGDKRRLRAEPEYVKAKPTMNEISKRTAYNYAKKAEKDIEDLENKRRNAGRAGKPFNKRLSDKESDRLDRRQHFLKRATDKVNETSNLDEISDKLKGRYIRKATDSHQAASAERRDAISRGDKAAADKAAALMKKRNRGVSKAFGEETELDEVSQALGSKVAKARHDQASALRQKAVDEPDMMKAFKHTKDANRAERKAGQTYNRLMKKEEAELDEYNTKSSKVIVTKDNKPVAIYSDLKSAQKDYHGKDGHAIGMRSASAAMRIKKENPGIKIVEAVTTADKKPETYVGPDGKPKTRMVPTHRDVIKEKSVSQAQQKAAGAALSAKRGEIKPSELVGASREMYDSMTTKELEDFASTKHKGLPKKVEEEVKQIEENLKKAAADLKRYADRHGGSDKQDYHTAANHMMSGNHGALERHLNRQDSEPRDTILKTLHKHGNDVKRYGYSIREEAKPDAADVIRRKQQMASISKSDKDKLSKVADMMRREREKQAKKVSESTFISKFKEELKDKKRAMKEVKSAPKGYHFTRDGKLRKGDADQDGDGGRMLRSDPLDKQRSKIPPLPENDK